MAEPTPTEVSPWYLRNINQALALNEETGNVYLRTGFTGNIVIEGNVSIPGEVRVINSEEDPLFTHTHLHDENDNEYTDANPFTIGGNVGVVGNVTTIQGTDPWIVSGNVTIDAVTGNVNVTQGTDPWIVSGNVNANITNANIEVTQGTDPWVVSGNVNVDNFPATQTVDGTVNIGTLPEVEIKNDTGNPISVIGTTINPFGNPVVTVDDDTVQHTATNRRKVSNYEITNFNTFQYTKDPLIWDEETTGTASSTLDPYETVVIMSVGSSTGDKIVRQTKRVTPYIPGRENEILMQFHLQAQTAGVRQRAGLFDDEAGIYLEDDGTNYNLVVRKTTSGGLVETRVARANWNGDKLDGTGGSGLTIDFSKFQTMVIEYNWFTGHAEVKFIIDNYSHPVHQFEFNNAVDSVFTNNPYLPVRWELENTGGTAGTHTMSVGSFATLSESGIVPLGVKNTVSTPLTGINVTDSNTFYPIISIRIRTDRIKGVVLPLEMQVAALDNAPIFYKVFLNPTLTGATTWDTYSDTHIEFNTDATAIAPSDYQITSGYISPTGQGAKISLDAEAAFQIGRENMGTTSEVVTIAAASVSSNKDIYASISWIEVR